MIMQGGIQSQAPPGHYLQGGGQPQFQQISAMTMPGQFGSHMGAPMGQIPRQIGTPQPAPMAYPGIPSGSSSHLGGQLGPGRHPSGQATGQLGLFRARAETDTSGGGTPVGGGNSRGVERHSFGMSVNDPNAFGASLSSLDSRGYATRSVDEHCRSFHQPSGREASIAPALGSSRPQTTYGVTQHFGGNQTDEGVDGGLIRESSFNPVSNAIPCRVLVKDPRTGNFIPSTPPEPETDRVPTSVTSATRQPSQAPPITNSVQDTRRQEPEVPKETKEPVKVVQPSAPRKKYIRPHLPNTVPTKEGVEHLEPDDVFELLKNEACMLVDVRGSDRSAGLIDGAVHVPAIDKVMFPARVPDLIRCFAEESLVVFTCQYSAHRAPQCANWYREKAPASQRVAILSGGFRAWEANGFPVAMPSTTKDEDKAADAFAMKQGVAFVKKHAPEVYQRAQQRKDPDHQHEHPEQLEQQNHQQQTTPKPKTDRSERQERSERRMHDHSERPERSRAEHGKSQDHAERSERSKAEHGKSADEHSQQSTQRAQKSQQHQQTLQLQQQQQQLRQQLQQLQQQQQRQLERQQQQLLQQQRLQHHLQQQAEGMQAHLTPSAPSAQTRTPHRQPESNRGHPANTVPIIDGVEILDPSEVYNLLFNEECVLVDVRGDDRAAGLIAGAYHVPAIGEPMFPTRLPDLLRAFANENLVVFTCQYCAHRGPQCANWYREQANPRQRVAVLAGGFRGWEAAGLPVAAPVANPNEALVSTPGNPNEGMAPDAYAMQQGLEFAQAFPRQSGRTR